MIVDTNALSALANGDLSIRESIANAVGPFLPVIVIGEYRFGLLSSRERQKRLEWLYELSREWVVLDVSHETTLHYAEIRQQLKQQATPIPSNDTWIAALARQYTQPVLSNDAHFDLVPGIDRITF